MKVYKGGLCRYNVFRVRIYNDIVHRVSVMGYMGGLIGEMFWG